MVDDPGGDEGDLDAVAGANVPAVDAEIEKLIKDLENSERAFARAYLTYRETVIRTDKDGKPTAWLSIEDAKANAVLFFEKHDLPLPESCRYRLHAHLNIERSVEPS